MSRYKNSLIINCKGTKKNNKIEKCSFLYDGNWGDENLTTHQAYHESFQTKDIFWLGFDISVQYGKFSGRDGKNS